jgi:hypothetical protein
VSASRLGGPPVFFLSYARSRQVDDPVWPPVEVDEHVLRLFEDLTAHVNQLIAAPPGRSPGFMDMTMETGELWEKELLEAVGACQVLVCLLSPNYLTQSEWCAMEWDIFTRRAVLRRQDDSPAQETTIVPVLWVPIQEEIPPLVNKVTRFAPRGLPNTTIGAHLRSDGLYGLLITDRDAYRAVVWKLALHIQRLHALYHVEEGIPPSTAGLQRSFLGGSS